MVVISVAVDTLYQVLDCEEGLLVFSPVTEAKVDLGVHMVLVTLTEPKCLCLVGEVVQGRQQISGLPVV